MVDWAAIKTEYLASRTSFSQLADKYKINKSTISRRAKKEGWNKDAATICNEMQRATAEKIVATVSDTASEIASLQARARLCVWQELVRRMEDDVSEMDGADLRRMVQNYCDMNGAEQAKLKEDEAAPYTNLMAQLSQVQETETDGIMELLAEGKDAQL